MVVSIRKRIKTIALLSVCAPLAMMSVSNGALANASGEPKQYLHGVSFASVTELPSRSPTRVMTYGEDENQFIEIWASQNRDRIYPGGAGVVIVHGGCWRKEYGVDHVRPLATALSDDGYNVFAIEYRRTGQPGGGWPGSLNDVRNAVKAVRDQYPKSSLALVGHSAGGHLALLAATDASLRLDAVIGLAAITDVASYSELKSSCSEAGVAFMGASVEDSPEAYAKANTRDKKIVPPLYLLTGKSDSIVPESQNKHPQSKRFHGDNIGHFDWIHSQSEAYQHLKNTLGRLYE
ncbi:alpha/beta hydrolase family protein [Alteromonas facilis]|uniref:alpha/beta hydrolase family protein n=1 Tax=Alteromonas facilis TaxID=2048004 RepID=UPI000C29110E|nr:alpha/beta hydrolase [Alteromonas facilis]